ncbi:hypothetical protein [Microcoleus sp. herbarium14]|uniref:hypothetical protein n=1 Tax=Microcoleus sp. herbarium14 TaxID=3055439 RepID=UPI002FCEB794
MPNSNEAEIEKNLISQFPDDIRQWLRRNDPELYFILLSKLLPKCKEQLLLQEKLNTKEEELKNLDAYLKNAEIEVAATTAALRFWERDTPIIFPGVRFGRFSIGFWSIPPWSFFNTFFDWTLKIGLSVVPVLSLFSIIGVKLEEIQYTPQVLVSILCGISLVWLTSATVTNWIVSQNQNQQGIQGNNQLQQEQQEENTSQTKLDKFYRACFPAITKLTKLIFPIPILTSLIKIVVGTDLRVDSDTFLFFIIWLLEALIGYATVPPLIDAFRINQNSSTGLSLPLLTGEEKFEILLGVSIFALINIMFAIAKGRTYRVNSDKKIAQGKAIAERDMNKILLANCQKEIAYLKEKNQALEQLLRPNKLIEKFHQGIEYLSIWARQGKDYSGIDDPSPNIAVINNGKLHSPTIPVQEKSTSGEEGLQNSTN